MGVFLLLDSSMLSSGEGVEMGFILLASRRLRLIAILTAATLLALAAGPALANVPLIQVSTDTFTNAGSQHHTEVEPDTFTFGNTIVSAFQVGRIFDGGAAAIGFATSTDGGTTWTNGPLPGITKFFGSGLYDRASDPAVAYDAQDNVWMISSLALSEAGGVHGAAVVTSRSTDGGLHWGNPVTTAMGSNLDKNWIVCDNTSTSQVFGNCYTQFDDNAAGNRMKMTTSSNGGLIWGPLRNTGDAASGRVPYFYFRIVLQGVHRCANFTDGLSRRQCCSSWRFSSPSSFRSLGS